MEGLLDNEATLEKFRNDIFEGSKENLIRIGKGIFKRRLSPSKYIVAVVHADSKEWTNLRDSIAPGTNWAKIREQGQVPVAFGVTNIDLIEKITSVVPKFRDKVLEQGLAPMIGNVIVMILAGNGATLRELDCDEQ